MKSMLVILLVLLLPSFACGQDFTKEEFGFGLVLHTDNRGAFYGVTLPHDVYVNTALENLGDIRVFNNENRIVPHELRYPYAGEERAKERSALPFFPLLGMQNSGDAELAMRIETGREGEIVNIERRSPASKEVPAAYLVDTTSDDESPASLRLEWESDGPGKLLPVIVEDSGDLVSWQEATRSTVADLVFMNNRLRHNEITLPRKTRRYIRLRAENGMPFPELTLVEAIYRPQRQLSRRWINMPFRVEKQDDGVFLELEPVPTMAIDGLKMEFDQPNSLLKVRIVSFDSAEKRQYSGEGLFYSLADDGNALHNEPMLFRRHAPVSIRLELLENGIGAELESTRIFLGYTPQEMIFVGRGSSPYMLAYGNGRMANSLAKTTNTSLQSLAENDEQSLIRQAEIGKRITLGGEKMLEIPPANPWKKRILWLVLLSGVAVLAAMAWSLTRKMKS